MRLTSLGFVHIIGAIVVPSGVGGPASGLITHARRALRRAPQGMSPFDSTQGEHYATARILARSLPHIGDGGFHLDSPHFGFYLAGPHRSCDDCRGSIRRRSRNWHLRHLVRSDGQDHLQGQNQSQAVVHRPFKRENKIAETRALVTRVFARLPAGCLVRVGVPSTTG